MVSAAAKHVDDQLRRGWYAPSDAARAATVELLDRLSSEGIDLPSLDADMFGGLQCEWEFRTGFVIVCIDHAKSVQLIVQQHDGAECKETPRASFESVSSAILAMAGR